MKTIKVNLGQSESLVALIEPFIDSAFDGVPDDVQNRWESPDPWDSLTPDQRLEWARQTDQDENEFAYFLAVNREIGKANQHIEKLKLESLTNIPIGVVASKDAMDAAGARLRKFKALRDRPAFTISDWRNPDTWAGLSDAKLDAILAEQLQNDTKPAAGTEAPASVVEEPAPVVEAPASVVEAPASKPRRAAEGPQFTMKKSALIEQHKHEWPGVERDIADANRNGLSAAAKAGAREWREADAMEWARTRGRVKSAERPADLLASPMPTVNNLPTRRHTMKG